MRLGFVLATMCGIACLPGCRYIDDLLAEPIRQAAEREIASLNERVASQEKSINKLRSDLETAITNLKRDVEVHEFARSLSEDRFKSESAVVTTDSGGYGVARTSIGPALVFVKGVTPYLNGFKLKLWIAMLAPISAHGAKVTVDWTETEAAFQETPGQSFRTKEFALADRFEGGRYTEVELALTPASGGGLKKLTVAIETNQLSVKPPASP